MKNSMVCSVVLMLALALPARAEVLSLEVGVHTSCPYGLIA